MQPFPLSAYYYLYLIFFCVTLTGIEAQGKSQESKDFTTKKRLVILPAASEGEDPFDINQEATNTVASLAVWLGRYEVVDRNNLQQILDEQDLYLLGLIDDSSSIEIGKIASAQEALLITVLNFSQKGVPPDSEDEKAEDDDDDALADFVRGLLSGIFGKKSARTDVTEEKYAHNIQTQLTVEITGLNIETGNSLYSFIIDSDHTGGTSGQSRAKVMGIFREEVSRQLRIHYPLNSRVVSSSNGDLILFLGQSMGVHRGMLFTIKEPDRVETYGINSITIPGRAVAYAKVTEISGNSNRSRILRKWSAIEPGFEAVEQIDPLRVGQVEVLSGLGGYPVAIGLSGWLMGALDKFDLGVAIRYFKAPDTFDDVDDGINLVGRAGMRLNLNTKLSLTSRLNIDFVSLSRSDHAKNTVSLELVSPSLELNTEIFLSRYLDLVIGAGFRFGGKSSDWSYSENDPDSEKSKNIPAEWDGEPPIIDISGLYTTAGIRLTITGF